MPFKALFVSVLLGLATFNVAASPITRDTCVVLSPGRYTISAASNNWQLRPVYHSMAPPAIASHEEAPEGQTGIWELSNAPRSAYTILNVGQNKPVTVLQYGTGLPSTATGNEGATQFAIQCAGNGQYTIKNPVADELWTGPPDAWVTLLPANGDITQRFYFRPV